MKTCLRRRPLVLAGVAAACAARLLLAPVPALADGAPTLATVQPLVLQPNGQPLHLTLTGTDLNTVVSVTLVPPVSGVSFTIVGDSVLLVTLPASTPVDTYSLFVTGTAGTSDPSASPTFSVAYPVAVNPGPPPAPKYSFAPYPGTQPQQPEPQTGVIDPGVSVSHPDPPAPRPLNPLVLLPLGIVVGGLGYLLWGRPGRLAAADRQGLMAHLVGRPVQALNIGRICLQCGRLHFILGTRRDLWRAGQFCTATCFVAAQEDDSAARAGESTAVTRMREMFVYSELEQNLQAALAGDVHALEHAAAIGDPGIEAVLAPPS